MTFAKRISQTIGTVAAVALLAPAALAVTTPTIEPRIATAPGSGQTLVFTFNKEVTGGTAAVTLGTAAVGSVTLGSAIPAPNTAPNDLIVNLTGVADLQCVTVTVSNVTSADGGTAGTGTASIRYIAGDANQSGQVTPLDKNAANFVQGPTTAANYLKDVNASGAVTPVDLNAINFRQGPPLPNCP
jgi:hypothetical protein